MPDDPLSINYFEGLFTRLKQNSVILMDTDGFILDINTAFTGAYGYTRDELVGKNFSILFTEENKMKDLPRRELNITLTQGSSSDNNYLVNNEKKLIWVAGESVLLNDQQGTPYILKIIHNIQIQKESEASIMRLNDLNESILSSIDDIVLVLNEQLNIERANSAFFKLFNNKKDVIETLPRLENLFKSQEEKEGFLNSIRETISQKRGFSKKEVLLIGDDGKERIFHASCNILHNTIPGNHVLLIFHDITDNVQIEKEREDIIGFVAHELRNPLANIILCNEMINRLVHENRQEQALEFVSRSNNNTMRLNKMISELNDSTKVNSGNFTLEYSTFNVSEMVKEAINTIAILQPAYHIILNDNVQGLEIRADRYRLMQVVTNFLTNSIKYSNGNVNIYISVQSDEGSVTVSVKDEGLGIAKEQLPLVFERFFRAEKTRNMEGIGLGLFLCRGIIKAHNGKIWVESEEGKGSTFYFSVPIS
jgi:PAS domain S-box-containing protein